MDILDRKVKTKAMMLLEHQLEKDISVLLQLGSLSQLERQLGIDRTTISKWRKRLGIKKEEK